MSTLSSEVGIYEGTVIDYADGLTMAKGWEFGTGQQLVIVIADFLAESEDKIFEPGKAIAESMTKAGAVFAMSGDFGPDAYIWAFEKVEVN